MIDLLENGDNLSDQIDEPFEEPPDLVEPSTDGGVLRFGDGEVGIITPHDSSLRRRRADRSSYGRRRI